MKPRDQMQMELETRGAILAFIAVQKRFIQRELHAVKAAEAEPRTPAIQRANLSRRRIEAESALMFLQEHEPYAGRLAKALTNITHPHLLTRRSS